MTDDCCFTVVGYHRRFPWLGWFSPRGHVAWLSCQWFGTSMEALAWITALNTGPLIIRVVTREEEMKIRAWVWEQQQKQKTEEGREMEKS